jgi:hypothetical protein
MKLAKPPVELNFKPLDYLPVLAQIHEELGASSNGKSYLYLLQSEVFRVLCELKKLLQQSLQSPSRHARHHNKFWYASFEKFLKEIYNNIDRKQ